MALEWQICVASGLVFFLLTNFMAGSQPYQFNRWFALLVAWVWLASIVVSVGALLYIIWFQLLR